MYLPNTRRLRRFIHYVRTVYVSNIQINIHYFGICNKDPPTIVKLSPKSTKKNRKLTNQGIWRLFNHQSFPWINTPSSPVLLLVKLMPVFGTGNSLELGRQGTRAFTQRLWEKTWANVTTGPSMENKVVVSNIFDFHPYVGKIPILTNIFQRGWNHQLENIWEILACGFWLKKWHELC